jgi:hypothetical protein
VLTLSSLHHVISDATKKKTSAQSAVRCVLLLRLQQKYSSIEQKGKRSSSVPVLFDPLLLCTHKKENQIFLIYKEIQRRAVAKSYLWKGFLIYEEMRKYFTTYEEAVSHI